MSGAAAGNRGLTGGETALSGFLSGGLGERNTQEIEVERGGGEQAYRLCDRVQGRVGSLKPLQDLSNLSKLSKPASALLFLFGKPPPAVFRNEVYLAAKSISRVGSTLDGR